MKRTRSEQSSYITPGGELSLSGSALVVLLSAVFQKGRPFRFKAKGGSMWPFIQHGDIITIHPLGTKSLGLGDVVLFLREKDRMPVVHRIVGGYMDKLLMKGDSSDTFDGLFSRTDILGKVTQVNRDGRLVRAGLGPERIILGLLSNMRFLRVIASSFRRFLRFIDRKVK